jgi:hypothetical protein
MYLTHFVNKVLRKYLYTAKTQCQSTEGDNVMRGSVITVPHLILFKRLNKGTENLQHVLYIEK